MSEKHQQTSDIDIEGAIKQRQRKSDMQLAIEDLQQGFACSNIWLMMAWQEIQMRYRRSLLGPLWLTISTGVLIGAMGPLYGKLFNMDIATYLGFLATGIVTWQLISSLLNESCQAFTGAESFIKQLKLPYTLHILRIIWKNIIIFFHNLLVLVIVFIIIPPDFSLYILLAPVGLVLIAINALWAGVILGLICARFQDVSLLIINLVQLAFFLTPVMWQPSMLGGYAWVVELNPFYHFMEIIRGPLLGSAINTTSWIVVLIITICGFGLMLRIFSSYRKRIAYWV